jgi:uncharacterized protein
VDLKQKAALLEETLRDLGSLMVAYSGGTDSAFLAYAAQHVLGSRMLAVIADSASLPRRELAAALEFAALHDISVHVIATGELDNPEYRRNDAQRCFHCKDELFARMESERERLGFAHIAYGMNLDDRGELRPGQRAAGLHGVVAPLVTAELTKAEVRALAREAGLSLADKPASACLSSRIEYGRAVTVEALSQVERAEEAVRGLGFAQVRVRHHGELARVEIARAELERALSLEMLDRMTAALRAIGFVYVTLDTQGYRSGSMNDVLPASAITAAHGAGAWNPKSFPDVLRLSVGEDAEADLVNAGEGASETVAVIETALDDLSPQVLAYVAEKALAAGALDVMLTPVVMKKGRPGTLLTVLCHPADSSLFEQMLLNETSTLGIRVRQDRRVCLERKHTFVETVYGPIRMKIGLQNGEERNAAPEFEDCRAAAERHGVALKQVQQAAIAAYRR